MTGGEEFREIARAARVGEGEGALRYPEVLLDEPHDAAEIFGRIADEARGRVGEPLNCRHTRAQAQ